MRYELYVGCGAEKQLSAESDDLSEITAKFFKLAEQEFVEHYDRLYVWDNDTNGVYIGVKSELNHERIY